MTPIQSREQTNMSGNLVVETPRADPQKEEDFRGVGIDQVGINNVQYPVRISGWDASGREEIREVNLSLRVSLAPDIRGIHMSRLLEGLHKWQQPLSPKTMADFLSMMREQQSAYSASVNCSFTWFVERSTPTTKLPSWQGIETSWHGHQDGEESTVGYTLNIPVTTLCPCSKEISDYGAHSQRGWVKVKLEWNSNDEIIYPEEIFDQLQHAGSAPIYPLLKRADERHVTMLAYEQPAFVEDTIRKAAMTLQADSRIKRFELEICNEESIHTHNAVANLNFNR